MQLEEMSLDSAGIDVQSLQMTWAEINGVYNEISEQTEYIHKDLHNGYAPLIGLVVCLGATILLGGLSQVFYRIKRRFTSN